MKKKIKKKSTKRRASTRAASATRRVSLRELVDGERFRSMLFDAIAASVATRLQAAWQEQHTGEQLALSEQSITVEVSVKTIHDIALDASSSATRSLESFMVKL